MMTYSKQLESLRQQVIDELIHQVPTRHDWIDLIDEEDEDNRENLPMVNIRWKHGLYSTEYVLQLLYREGKAVVKCEDTESGNISYYETDILSTGELCEILDQVLLKIK